MLAIYLSTIVPLGLSLVALGISVYTFRKQRIETSYSDIDQTYFELLKTALHDPSLRLIDRTSAYYLLPKDDPFRLKYDVYAYMCWNLVETIYDRTHGMPENIETWRPVIDLETKLHSAWFKKNLSLFKARFRREIMKKIMDFEIVEGRPQDLDSIYQKLQRDFPPGELKSLEQINQLMAAGKQRYKLLMAKQITDGALIGYAFVYEPRTPKIAWLDYLAIEPTLRDAGYGTTFLDEIEQKYQKRGYLGIILEVEEAKSDNPETLLYQKRRISFYQRLGAKELNIPYLFPTAEGALPLKLFFKPMPNVTFLTRMQIQILIKSAFSYIHKDVPHQKEVLKTFIGEVQDQFLEQ